MPLGANDEGDDSTPVEEGYEWLSDRAAKAINDLTSIDIGPEAAILADDQFFHPIFRTVSQDVAQCLLSALDHLRFLVWSLKTRDKPYPYAQATLIRTAITGAATALWMVSPTEAIERRCRAMEFMFIDLKSQLTWMDTAAEQPMNRYRPAAEWAQFQQMQAEMKRRQEWILQQASTLLSPDTPFTRKTYGRTVTSDSDIVKAAGAITPALGMGGWDPERVLLGSWRVLSGYAHARPWAVALGSTIVVTDPEPHPTTGRITVAAEGNPDRLLDMAFRAMVVVETGVRRLEKLSQ